MRGTKSIQSALLMMVVSLSGCVGGGTDTDDAGASAPLSADDSGDGWIDGRVIDDELRPLAQAHVAVIDAQLETRTEADGTFRLGPLAPGVHRVVAQRLGFSSIAQQVEILPDQTSQVELVLRAIAIADEAYTSSLQSVGQIHFDNIYLSDCLANCGQYLNNSVVNNLRCDPCQFVLHIGAGPADGLSEATWEEGALPVINPDMCTYYRRNWTEEDAGVFVWHDCHTPDEPRPWPGASVNDLAKSGATALKLYLFGATQGISFEQKIELWTSFGYGADLPDGFSALPP